MRRMGNNKKPFFRIVATDERAPQSGRYLENVGWYDPKLKGSNQCELKLDRIEHWKSKGAIITHAVQNLVRKATRASKAA
jgi:small subunit ribosomal protein S16